MVEDSHRPLVQVGEPPIESRAWYAKRILLRAQCHTRVRIRCLLLARRQMKETRWPRSARRRCCCSRGDGRRSLSSIFLPRSHRVHHHCVDELERALDRLAVVPRFYGCSSVEDAMLSLRCGRDGELSPRRSTQAGEFVQPGLRHLRLRQRQLAARHLEVLHEVAPNEVVAVAESGAGLSIRSEKESRVLDGVTGEDKPFCPHVKFLAIEPTDSHRLYGGDSH